MPSNPIQELQRLVKHPRPSELSDPYHDFGFGCEILARLLATEDADLTWNDYQLLLGPFLPAGTYDEVVYYLPRAFAYMLAHDEEALDLVLPTFGYIKENEASLRADGLFECAMECIRHSLESWTSEFKVIYHNQAGIQPVWSPGCMACIHRYGAVVEGVELLVKWRGEYTDLVVSFIASKADHRDDPVKAAWMLELARWFSEQPKQRGDKAVRQLLTNKDALKSCAEVFRADATARTVAPEYWSELRRTLGV